MPKDNPVLKNIKEAKFIHALVENAGQENKAYKAIRPHVTDNSARILGSQTLARINPQSIVTVLERVGCTQEIVLSGLWKRMQGRMRDGDYIRSVDVLAKLAGWYAPKDQLRDLIADGLDLVEIVKVRLRKSSDNKHIDKAIDVSSTSTDGVVKEDIGKA